MVSTASSSALRILFVNSGLGYGGAETQLIAILRELRRRGHQPSLYLLTPDAPRLAELTDHGIEVTVDDKRSRLDLGVLSRLRRHIRTHRPQLVQGFLFDANIYTRLAGIGLGVPILNSERSHGYKLRTMQRLIHYPTRFLVDGVIANSHAGREFAERMFGLDQSRTHTVWNGVDLAAIDRLVMTSNVNCRKEFFNDTKVRLAVMIGTIKTEKDHLLAIAVAEQLIAIDPTWRVAFVGASYDESQLRYKTKTTMASNILAVQVRERWRQSPQRESMAFIGQRRDVVEIIAEANVLFSTSRREGFPNVVLEAMTVGTPVVSTLYSDIEQILPARLVVRQRDPTALMLAIVAAEAEGPTLGKELRAWVEAHATIERSVEALLAIYLGYIDEKTRSTP